MTENWEKSNMWNKFKSIELYSKMILWTYEITEISEITNISSFLSISKWFMLGVSQSHMQKKKWENLMQKIMQHAIKFRIQRLSEIVLDVIQCEIVYQTVLQTLSFRQKHMQMKNCCSYVLYSMKYIICDVWGKYWLIFVVQWKCYFDWYRRSFQHNGRHLLYSILKQQCHECQETLERRSMT